MLSKGVGTIYHMHHITVDIDDCCVHIKVPLCLTSIISIECWALFSTNIVCSGLAVSLYYVNADVSTTMYATMVDNYNQRRVHRNRLGEIVDESILGI